MSASKNFRPQSSRSLRKLVAPGADALGSALQGSQACASSGARPPAIPAKAGANLSLDERIGAADTVSGKDAHYPFEIANLAVASVNAVAAVGVRRPRQRPTRATAARRHEAAARSRRTPPRGEHDGAQGAARPLRRRPSPNERRRRSGANEGCLTPFPAGKTSKSSDCRGRAGRKSRRRRSRPTAAPARLPLRRRTGAGDNAAARNSTSDLFSVSRARLAADSGREPGKRGSRPRDGDPGRRPRRASRRSSARCARSCGRTCEAYAPRAARSFAEEADFRGFSSLRAALARVRYVFQNVTCRLASARRFRLLAHRVPPLEGRRRRQSPPFVGRKCAPVSGPRTKFFRSPGSEDYATKLPRTPKPRTLKAAALTVAAGYRNPPPDQAGLFLSRRLLSGIPSLQAEASKRQ